MSSTTDALFDLPPADPDRPTVEQLVAEALRDRAVDRGIRRALGPGPVYQGVSRTIRKLTATGKKYRDDDPLIDPVMWAGTIATARQLARTIDKSTGHNPRGWVANGRDLSPLVEQLRELMGQLSEAAGTSTGDPFLAWLASDDDDAPVEPSRAEL